MYGGEIGTLKISLVHFEQKENEVLYHCKAFPIPKAYKHLTKEECHRFKKAGIWTHTQDTVWAVPTFIVPKKTNDVRIVTDFLELNKNGSFFFK